MILSVIENLEYPYDIKIGSSHSDIEIKLNDYIKSELRYDEKELQLAIKKHGELTIEKSRLKPYSRSKKVIDEQLTEIVNYCENLRKSMHNKTLHLVNSFMKDNKYNIKSTYEINVQSNYKITILEI